MRIEFGLAQFSFKLVWIRLDFCVVWTGLYTACTWVRDARDDELLQTVITYMYVHCGPEEEREGGMQVIANSDHIHVRTLWSRGREGGRDARVGESLQTMITHTVVQSKREWIITQYKCEGKCGAVRLQMTQWFEGCGAVRLQMTQWFRRKIIHCKCSRSEECQERKNAA